MKKEFPSMKEKDGKRKEIPTIGIRVFGYQIWFQAEGGRAFRRACRMAGRLCRNAEKLNDQLLRLQKLIEEMDVG